MYHTTKNIKHFIAVHYRTKAFSLYHGTSKRGPTEEWVAQQQCIKKGLIEIQRAACSTLHSRSVDIEKRPEYPPSRI